MKKIKLTRANKSILLKALAPYYIAEIYLIKKNYDKAEIVAQNYLSAYPDNEYTAEMYRVLGDADYHFGKYHEAMEAFEKYLENNKEAAPRRDALYMLGLSYYNCGVYSKADTTLGEVTAEKVRIVQDADAIYREEIAKAGLDRSLGQYFAALTNMRSVGCMGDFRTYDYAVALRAVNTTDFMTADCSEIPFEVLQKVMNRIINEVKGVNRVMYDLTSKPPGTIEFE